jgi:hypothetical protein
VEGKEDDVQAKAGFKGAIAGWNWHLGTGYGEDRFERYPINSANARSWLRCSLANPGSSEYSPDDLPHCAAPGLSFSIRIRKAREVCLRCAIHSDTHVSHETDFF